MAGIFHTFKTEVKAKNKAKIFPNSGCVLYADIGYFGILMAKVGVRIIGGCVLFADNYGK